MGYSIFCFDDVLVFRCFVTFPFLLLVSPRFLFVMKQLKLFGLLCFNFLIGGAMNYCWRSFSFDDALEVATGLIDVWSLMYHV